MPRRRAGPAVDGRDVRHGHEARRAVPDHEHGRRVRRAGAADRVAALQRPRVALRVRAGRRNGTRVTEQWDARPAEEPDRPAAAAASRGATATASRPPWQRLRRARRPRHAESGPGGSLDRRPGHGAASRRRAPDAGRCDSSRSTRSPGLAHLAAGEQLARAARPSRPSRSRAQQCAASSTAASSGSRASGPLPQHGAQLVLDAGRSRRGRRRRRARRGRQQVAALAVGVVDHRVEDRDPAQLLDGRGGA